MSDNEHEYSNEDGANMDLDDGDEEEFITPNKVSLQPRTINISTTTKQISGFRKH